MGSIPPNQDDLIKTVLNQTEARYNSAELNIAYRMNVQVR